ncbi:hypothetical protein BGZ49_003629 [Haplosporangium sp. Z 27]|nr:hypothetical protein BGZ49_003629 [Haplosporangium sp. Z 27]
MAEGSDLTNIQDRMSLKHKLYESEMEIYQAAIAVSTSAPMGPELPLPPIAHNTPSKLHTSVAAPSMTRQSVPSVGSPRSLSDRRKMTASQVSKRFIIGSQTNSVMSSQNSQRFSRPSNHQTFADTIPSQSMQLQTFVPTKTRKSSEFAKRMVLPAAEFNATNSKNKKKLKFTPPLISGGYAERFLNLMTYHKSEYTMWANATLRQEKHFASTEPLAVVEIKEISRDCNLQWTRCNIIFNENNKAPFNVRSEKDHNYVDSCSDVYQLQQANPNESRRVSESPEMNIVKSTSSQVHYEFTEDQLVTESYIEENEVAKPIIEEEDSINGLHNDICKMDVLISSQGSIFEGNNSDFMRSQQRPSTYFETRLVTINEDGDDSVSSLHFLKSSQGSDEGAEEPELKSRRHKETMQQSHMIPDALTVNLSCVKELTRNDNIASTNKVTSPYKAENVSISINPTSTSGVAQTIVNAPTYPEATKRVAAHENEELTPTIWIMFSSLFNWSRMKVNDKVEIHEPCRKIMISESGSGKNSTVAWVVERYKVVSI